MEAADQEQPGVLKREAMFEHRGRGREKWKKMGLQMLCAIVFYILWLSKLTGVLCNCSQVFFLVKLKNSIWAGNSEAKLHGPCEGGEGRFSYHKIIEVEIV